MRGFLAGALVLIGLQVLVSSNLPALGTGLAYPGQLAAKWMDPAVPLITATGSSSSSGSKGGSSGGNPISSAIGGFFGSFGL